MLANPTANESREAAGPTAAAANSSNPNTARPPPNPNQHHHHARSSSARRSISSTGQLSTPANGTTNNTAMPTPVPPKGQPPGIPVGPGVAAFDGGRSPPGSKNLNHVPCKFFRQGACQAGKACPFSHSTDPSSDAAPCKYFSKGNCKFGAKCALAHILPDGRRVNRPAMHGGGHLQFGRMDTGFTNHRSALHNSLMQASAAATTTSHHTPNHSLSGQEEFPALPSVTQAIPQLDQTLSSSLPDSQFGSPRNADGLPVTSLGTSHRTLGPLDATLPASIDRYDYSYYAKHGPFASSVPNTFGVDSPPPSLPSSIRGETTVSALRRSAFGEDENGDLSRSAQLREGTFGERILHSSAARRNKVYSSSYGGPQTMFSGFPGMNGLRDNDRAIDTSEVAFAFEEDFLPESLTDLLTPAERNRRMSRTEEEGPSSFRHSFTAPGTPGDVFGSPPIGSPGSWGPLINRTKREEDHTQVSGLGHVGSPLRNSFLHPDTHPIGRGLTRTSSDNSPFTNSPARGGSGISALTQSLKLTGLHDGEMSGPLKVTGSGRPIERAIPSPGLGHGKVHPIDEEPETQFNLEVEEDAPTRHAGGFDGSGSNSGGLGLDVGGRYLSGRS